MSPLAWLATCAALSLGVLGAMTIGIFLLPFALMALLALLRWGNKVLANGGRECMEEHSPWPFLLSGA